MKDVARKHFMNQTLYLLTLQQIRSFKRNDLIGRSITRQSTRNEREFRKNIHVPEQLTDAHFLFCDVINGGI